MDATNLAIGVDIMLMTIAVEHMRKSTRNGWLAFGQRMPQDVIPIAAILPKQGKHPMVAK